MAKENEIEIAKLGFFPQLATDHDYSIEFLTKQSSIEFVILSGQYFHLENKLNGALEFIAPGNKNGSAFSYTNASIIREASALFELISRMQIEKLDPKKSKNEQNISDFMHIARGLRLSDISFTSNTFLDGFIDYPEVFKPFSSLVSQIEAPKGPISPKWWKANNTLKHSGTVEALEVATLGNAIAGVAANFVTLSRLFGPGGVCGQKIKLIGGSKALIPGRTSNVFDIVEWGGLDS